MAHLKDVIAYILDKYPHKGELSNARVCKMVYLADWHQAIHHNRQISNVNWYFDNYGPYVHDVKREVLSSPEVFESVSTLNAHNEPKTVFRLTSEDYNPRLSSEERSSLDHVIEQTAPMYWESFIKLVYSTHPILKSEKYSYLNLVELALDYSTGSVSRTSANLSLSN